MERAKLMNSLANDLTSMILTYGRRDDIIVKYGMFTADQLAANFSELQRRICCIFPDLEYFLVYETEKPVTDLPYDYQPNSANLLYAVNVSCDSYLTAAAELMDLASRKCL